VKWWVPSNLCSQARGFLPGPRQKDGVFLFLHGTPFPPLPLGLALIGEERPAGPSRWRLCRSGPATSSLYLVPASHTRRSSRSGVVRPVSAKSCAQEATRPTTEPLRSWSTSQVQSAQNPSRSHMFQYTRRCVIGRQYSL
jgi:hypothetical protein